jgi:hypothetical protein
LYVSIAGDGKRMKGRFYKKIVMILTKDHLRV